MSVKVLKLFHVYSLFFQQYILTLINLLKHNADLDIKILHYELEVPKNTIKISKCRTRQFKGKLNALVINKKGNYLERFWLKYEFQVLHVMDSFLFNKVLKLLDLPKDKMPKIIMAMKGSDNYVYIDLFKNYKHTKFIV